MGKFRNKTLLFPVFLILVLTFISFLNPVNAQTEEVKKYAVALEMSNVRSRPSVEGKIVFVARPGERMEILDDLGTWFKVKRKTGEVGYIFARLVRVEVVKYIKVPVKETKERKAPAPPEKGQVAKPLVPVRPPAGVKTMEAERQGKSKKLLYMAGGVVATGAIAYLLFRKGGLLNKGTATLNVVSDPFPATVYVDDEEKCTAPCIVEGVSPGTHVIKIERELYGKWEQEMELKGHNEYDIVVKLSPYKYTLKKCFGRRGSYSGQLSYAYDLTIDKQGYIYVADTGNDRIQKFSKDGYYISRVSFSGVSGIAYSSANNSIYAVSISSNYLRKYGLKLIYAFQKYLGLSYPRGLGIDSSGTLYIADSGHKKIIKAGQGGGAIKTWSVAGGSGIPYDAEPGKNGDIYVPVFNMDKIFVYSNTGAKKREFSRSIDGPAHIAFDRMGHVYVTSYFENKVYKFTAEGKFAIRFGTNFNHPLGIAVDRNGDVIVQDTYNYRICRYGISSETIGTATARITVKRIAGNVSGIGSQRYPSGYGSFNKGSHRPGRIKK